MKHTDYLKKKKNREIRRRVVSILSAIVVFVATYALVLPALTLDVKTARMEPGMSVQQEADPEAVSAPEAPAEEETVEESTKEEEPAEAVEPEKEEKSVKEESAKEDQSAQAEEQAPAEEASKDKADEAAQKEDAGQADADSAAADQAPAKNDSSSEAVDQSGADAAEENTKEAAAEAFKVPELEAIDFNEILTDKTDFYYYHADKDEDAAAVSSTDIDDWKKVKADTVLAPEDFVRVYLAYTIPAGALNETNATASYRLPEGLELTDKQIKAINKNENGISGTDKDAKDYKKYLGAEAIEGTRTPDKTRGDDEYISATVKVEKVYENDKYIGQDLVFTFAPYTVQKNQISYDDKGNVKSEGKAVKGWFSFDLTPSRIGFEETEAAAAESGLVRSEAKITFVKENNKKDIDEISRALTLDAPAGSDADKTEEKAEQTAEQKTLTYEGADYTVIIIYTDDAEIPDNATLDVSEIGKDTPEYKDYLEQAKVAVKEDKEDKTVNEARFFDITILADGEKVEPAAPVNVQINFAGIEQTKAEDAQLLHYKDDEVQVMDKAEFGKSDEAGSNAQAVDTVQFEADGFSVYGIVGTETITVDYLTADGKTLKVTVTFDENEVLPKGAELVVTEVQEGDKGWADRSARLAHVLSENYGNVTMSDSRLLNISIMVDGKEYEPKAPVEVKIEYTNGLYAENTQETFEDPMLTEPIEPYGEGHFVMAHYTNDGVEIMDSEIQETDGGVVESVATTSSFSEYDVAYIYEYDAPDAGTDSRLSSISGNHTADEVSKMVAAAPSLRSLAPDGTPDIDKSLSDNNDGTYQLGLSVTGDALTTATSSPVNVVIVYDVSTSMTGNRIPSATGAYGVQYYNNFDGVSDGQYFQLYKRVGYNNYQAITDAEAYTGTVYRYNNYRYTEYTGQRHHASITRADAGEKVVYDFTNALFGYQDQTNPNNIQVSLVTFSRTATIRNRTNANPGGWTSNKSTITDLFSSTGATNSHKLSYSGYTNWEAAMYQAYNVVNSADDDPTYVVFITDGQPTESNYNNQYTGTNVSGSSSNDDYRRALNEARLVEQAVTQKTGSFYSIYAYGKAADWLASLTYYAYNGSRPASNIEGTTFDTEGYYNASDTDALTAAINEIFSKIVDTLGVGSASINDGTTHSVQTTTGPIVDLLEVDDSTFQYWLTIPVVASGQNYNFSMTDKTTGDVVNYTASVSGENVTISWNNGANSASYKGNVNAGSLTLEWTQATPFYNFAPPTAVYNETTGAVDWNLNSLGTLLHNVTYTTTFDVYPSQYSLDLIADLENSCIDYDNLDANIKKYIKQSGDNYVLATNTGATLTYKDTRIDDQIRTKDYVDPDPRPLPTEQMTLAKGWSNNISDKNKFQSVTFLLKRDGKYYTENGTLSTEEGDAAEFVLNNGNGWNKSLYIAPGLVRGDKVLEPGHEYVLVEPDEGIILSDGTYLYDYEFTSQTVHPMMVNGKLTYLVKVDNYNPGTGHERYDLDLENGTFTQNSEGAYYAVEVEEGANGVLTGTNRKTAELDITKNIIDNTHNFTEAQLDAETFTYRVTLTVPVDADVSGIIAYEFQTWKKSDYNKKYTINGYQSTGNGSAIDDDVSKFSGKELGENNVTKVGAPDRTIASMFSTDPGEDTKTATVDITLTRNEIIRFTNLPEKTEYTIVEMYNNYREATPSRDRDASGSDMAANIADMGYTTSIATKSLNPITDTVRTGLEEETTTVSGTIDYLDVRYYNQFTNTLDDAIDVELQGTKHLDGYEWSGERYYYKLTANNDSYPLPIVGALGRVQFYLTEPNGTADKSYSFGKIRFTEAGTYTYQIFETNNLGGTSIADTFQVVNGTAVQYGAAETVTIVIAENNGKLSVESVTNSSKHTAWDATNKVANTTITNTAPKTDVTAKKAWLNADGTDTPPAGANVTFTLYSKIGSDEATTTGQTVELDGTVDEDGEAVAWEATFSGLQKYTVVNGEAVEIVYTIFEEDSGKWTGYDRVNTEPVASGGTITNQQSTFWVQFKKTDMDGDQDGHRLPGAVFTFNDGIDATDITVTSGTDGIMATTPGQGETAVNKFRLAIRNNPYVLTETTAPYGYNKLTDVVNVNVNTTGVTAKLGDGTSGQYAVTGNGTEDNPYVVIITNSTGYELPNSGGIGTLPYTIGGLMLVIASALMYGFRLRRRERRFN